MTASASDFSSKKPNRFFPTVVEVRKLMPATLLILSKSKTAEASIIIPTGKAK